MGRPAKLTNTPLREQIEVVSSKKRKTSKGKVLSLDLRIYTANPIAQYAPTDFHIPEVIARIAKAKGLNYIGVGGKRHFGLYEQVKKSAFNTSVNVYPFIEIEVKIHPQDTFLLACYFSPDSSSKDLEKYKEGISNIETANKDNIKKTIKNLCMYVESRGGFILPIESNRTPLRKAAIPFLVEELGFRTFEVTFPEDAEKFFAAKWPEKKFNLFSFSGAESFAQIGAKWERFLMTDKQRIEGFFTRINFEEKLPTKHKAVVPAEKHG